MFYRLFQGTGLPDGVFILLSLWRKVLTWPQSIKNFCTLAFKGTINEKII